MVGFCTVEVKLLGPLQFMPVAVLEVRFRVCPAHRGLLLPSTGVAGTGFTVTFRVAVADVHPLAAV